MATTYDRTDPYGYCGPDCRNVPSGRDDASGREHDDCPYDFSELSGERDFDLSDAARSTDHGDPRP